MTSKEILKELAAFGNEGTKKILTKHGAKEPFFGVKVADLKKILKKTKKNHALSLELFETGNSDAMYLAGLMADETKMTKEELQHWAEQAYWYYLSEHAVAAVAAESEFGFQLAQKWIKSKKENIASSGWSTLTKHASITPDEELDIATYEKLLNQIPGQIHGAPNRVRYTMNGFVIAVGSYISSLTKKAQEIGEKIGKVEVEMGGTACKVPLATEYLEKMIAKDRVGKKRKVARC